jgi:hypothetical protein
MTNLDCTSFAFENIFIVITLDNNWSSGAPTREGMIARWLNLATII